MLNIIAIVPHNCSWTYCKDYFVNFIPDFYKPDNGVLLEQWLVTKAYKIDQMEKPPFSDDCPKFAINLDNFEFRQAYSSHQNIIASTYFVSKQTGLHKFFAICDDFCSLEIHLPQYAITKELIKIPQWHSDNWDNRYDVFTLLNFQLKYI